MYGFLRLTLDTNILVSALMTKGTPPGQLYHFWKDGMFTLVTSEAQLIELQRVLTYPKLKPYIHSQQASIFLTTIQACATIVQDLDTVHYSPDSSDNAIIVTALKGECTYLVTGDKKDLLFLEKVENLSIITAKNALKLFDEPVLRGFIQTV